MSRRIIKDKKINPKIYIFCEGESENVYIQFLKTKFRLPVQVVTKVTKNKISTKLLKSNINSSEKHEKDRVFRMYAIDVEGFLEKLQEISKHVNCDLLISNPCIELWFLLHYINQNSEISSNNCIQKIETFISGYKKGTICNKLKKKLDENGAEAKKRASKLTSFKNPSTTIYQLIDYFENIIINNK